MVRQSDPLSAQGLARDLGPVAIGRRAGWRWMRNAADARSLQFWFARGAARVDFSLARGAARVEFVSWIGKRSLGARLGKGADPHHPAWRERAHQTAQMRIAGSDQRLAFAAGSLSGVRLRPLSSMNTSGQ